MRVVRFIAMPFMLIALAIQLMWDLAREGQHDKG